MALPSFLVDHMVKNFLEVLAKSTTVHILLFCKASRFFIHSFSNYIYLYKNIQLSSFFTIKSIWSTPSKLDHARMILFILHLENHIHASLIAHITDSSSLIPRLSAHQEPGYKAKTVDTLQ